MTTTAASPLTAPGCGPLAAQNTADIRFSVASEEPLSEDLCEPTKAILPREVPYLRQTKRNTLLLRICVEYLFHELLPLLAQPSSNACLVASIILFQC